jgi:hypothetical protein
VLRPIRAVKAISCPFIAAIQNFGNQINFHLHLHFLVTEAGMDGAGVFHGVSSLDDARLAELFACEGLAMLVRKELLRMSVTIFVRSSFPHARNEPIASFFAGPIISENMTLFL